MHFVCVVIVLLAGKMFIHWTHQLAWCHSVFLDLRRFIGRYCFRLFSSNTNSTCEWIKESENHPEFYLFGVPDFQVQDSCVFINNSFNVIRNIHNQVVFLINVSVYY